MPPLATAVSVVITGLGVAAPVPAQDVRTFEQGLELVERRMEAERWESARALLLEIAEEHEGQYYARATAGHLAGLILDCAFAESYEAPELDELLAGEVVSFDARRARIEVRYTKETPRRPQPTAEFGDPPVFVRTGEYSFAPHDFVDDGPRQIWGVPFAGPHTIVIEGVMPEAGSPPFQPEVVAGLTDESFFHVTYTWPVGYGYGYVGQWDQGQFHFTRAGATEVLERDRQLGIKYSLMWGEPYELKVRVLADRIVATLNGIRFLSVDKSRETFGHVGFGWCPNVERITIDGDVDPAWIDAALENDRTRAHEIFAAHWDADAELPAWLAEAVRR